MRRTIATTLFLGLATHAFAQAELDEDAAAAEREAAKVTDSAAVRSDTPGEQRGPVHELTHTVQQRAPVTADGTRQGVVHQQGRIGTDADHNERPDPPTSITAPKEDGIDTPDPSSLPPPGGPVPMPYPNVAAPAESRNPFLPQIDDEVLLAFEQGDFEFDGQYYVVEVAHRQPVKLPAGRYRTPGGRALTLENGEVRVDE